MRGRKSLPFVALAVCAAAVLYWRLIFVPIQAEISSLKMQARQLQMQARMIAAYEARYGDLELALEDAEERLALAQVYLPPEMNSEKFIAACYEIADIRKIFINSVSVGEINGDTVQSLPVKIRFEGKFVPLLNFIREILDGDRGVRLDGCLIERDSGFITGEIDFTIFAAKT